MTLQQTPSDQLLKITHNAREKVLELLDQEVDSDELALWIEVTGISQGSYVYEMYFEAKSHIGNADAILTDQRLTIVIPATSIANLTGSTLDLGQDLVMTLNNPNRPATPKVVTNENGSVETNLNSEVAKKVLQVLETQINPSIAAHGGVANLVAVQANIAYLRLGGGCHGCGVAPVTLSQGIKVAIQTSVPEIIDVVDVTDHASGTNPFYESV